MLRPPTALDVDPSSETLSPATTVADDGTITAVGGLLIVSIVLAAVCTPRSSVTVSVTVTVPGAVGSSVAVDPLTALVKLAVAPPLVASVHR